MGSEQSSSSEDRSEKKYTKRELERMLKNQRKQFEQKKTASNTINVTYSAVREEARKEVERLLRQHNLQSPQQQIPSPSTLTGTTDNQKHDVTRPTAPMFWSDNAASSTSGVRPYNNNLAGAGADQYNRPTQTPSQVKPRSHSAQRRNGNNDRRNGATNNDNDTLTCPGCNKRYTQIIFQCEKGHSYCDNCKASKVVCSVCGLPIAIRNRSLEAFVGELKEKCPNAESGCRLFIQLAAMDIHVKECPFKVLTCPIAGVFGENCCKWRGMLPKLESHFNELHAFSTQGNIGKEMHLTLTNKDCKFLYLVTIGPFNFLFNVKVSYAKQQICMAVQLIGTAQSAKKWNYEIHVFNKSKPRRKYLYYEVCQSNATSINEIMESEECATIPLSYANTFVNEGHIAYKFYIKKIAG